MFLAWFLLAAAVVLLIESIEVFVLFVLLFMLRDESSCDIQKDAVKGVGVVSCNVADSLSEDVSGTCGVDSRGENSLIAAVPVPVAVAMLGFKLLPVVWWASPSLKPGLSLVSLRFD